MSKLGHFILNLDGTIAYPYPIFVKICHEIAKEQGIPFDIDDLTLDKALKINVLNSSRAAGEPIYKARATERSLLLLSLYHHMPAELRGRIAIFLPKGS